MECYKISKEILNKVFMEIINTDSVKNTKNAKHIKEIIFKELNEHSIEHIIHLILTETEYEPLQRGEYFKTKPPIYDISKYYESDTLTDMGLMDSEGNVFGFVEDDTSWGNIKIYNPLYRSLKVKLLYHDEKLQLNLREVELNPLELIKCDKLDIEYFNKIIVEPECEKQLTLEF